MQIYHNSIVFHTSGYTFFFLLLFLLERNFHIFFLLPLARFTMNYFSYWTAAGENELENFLSAHYKQLKTNKRNERKFLGISLFILYLFFFRSVIQFHITRLLYILPHSWIRVFGKIYNQRIKIHFNKCTKRNAKLFLCESHIHWMKLQKKMDYTHTHTQ